MALTPDKLKSITVLKDLSPDQITAITNLSATDEQVAINEAQGKAYGYVDDAIKEITGAAKPHGKLTSEFVKETIKKLKDESSGDEALKSKIKELENEIKTLEKSAKEGGDQKVRAELETTKNELLQLKTNYATFEQSKKKELEAKEAEILEMRNSQYLDQGLAGLTFISEDIINSDTRRMAIELEKKKILQEYDIIDEGGKKRFIHKVTKMPLVDPDNLANDMSVGQLMASRLGGLIDKSKHAGGGGAGAAGGGGTGGNGSVLDLKGVKSKTQAHAAVHKYLAEKGLVASTEPYQQEMNKIWQENKLSELPIHAPNE